MTTILTNLPTLGLAAIAMAGCLLSEPAYSDRKIPDYQATGEVKDCLVIRDLRSTRVLDDKTIIFTLRNRKQYRNTLPHACPRLGFHEAFSYEVVGSHLCDVDTIRVFEPHAMGVACGLGKFERVEPIKHSPG